ncbi:MAG: GspE/PulE family protein [bacterium]
MLPEKILKTVLKKTNLCSGKDLRLAQERAEKGKKTLEQILIELELVDEQKLYQEIGQYLDVPFVELKGKEIKKEVINLIPTPVAGTHQVVAFDKERGQVKLAMVDPTDIQTIEFLRRKTGLDPKVYITCPSDLKQALRLLHADLEDNLQIIKDVGSGVDGKELKKAAEELPIINIVNTILEHAVYENTSDVHIEPAEKQVVVRYRIDGILKQVMTLPKNIQKGLIARIKILSNLKIDEHMQPQDGRFKIQLHDDKVALRVSIIPVYDGEKVVMRILHEGAKPLTLEQLGFLQKPQAIVESVIKKPHGMILVTGPTGSGKTTTLYSILGILNQPGVNISTIEDPIEYRIPGINQSQINPKAGFSFANGLRSFLRQDPDIIMVGEIRDQETAEIGIHAAMTGHLVLSTLHTNDAPTTLPRLVDMGVPPFLVGYTTNVVIAQRLVRKICSHCKKEYRLDKTAITELTKVFTVKKLTSLIKEHLDQKKVKDSFEHMTFYKGEGCQRCGQTGYKGRIGIYEVLEIDEGLIKKINQHATANDIKEYAREHGMLTILEDGLLKSVIGITTINEVLRVTKD